MKRQMFIVRVLHQIAQGLDFMHRHNKLHQSLGPESIALTRYNVAPKWTKPAVYSCTVLGDGYLESEGSDRRSGLCSRCLRRGAVALCWSDTRRDLEYCQRERAATAEVIYPSFRCRPLGSPVHLLGLFRVGPCGLRPETLEHGQNVTNGIMASQMTCSPWVCSFFTHRCRHFPPRATSTSHVSIVWSNRPLIWISIAFESTAVRMSIWAQVSPFSTWETVPDGN